jgi:hypothetical protein
MSIADGLMDLLAVTILVRVVRPLPIAGRPSGVGGGRFPQGPHACGILWNSFVARFVLVHLLILHQKHRKLHACVHVSSSASGVGGGRFPQRPHTCGILWNSSSARFVLVRLLLHPRFLLVHFLILHQ